MNPDDFIQHMLAAIAGIPGDPVLPFCKLGCPCQAEYVRDIVPMLWPSPVAFTN